MRAAFHGLRPRLGIRGIRARLYPPAA